MTKFFQHTPQMLGSSTSPTSDLALEVSEAFGKVEGLLDTEGTTIVSFKKALGNALFSSLKPHRVFKNMSETHTMLENESDIVLENKPEVNDVVVYFTTDVTGETQTLDQIEPNKDFTDVNQFKLLGKVVKLNIRVPKGSSLTISVDYSTTTFDLNGKKFLPNVIKKDNEEFFIVPSAVTATTFELDFETDLNSTLSERMINPQEVISFFYSYDRNTFESLEVDDYTIVGNKISISGNKLPNSLVDLEVIAYINNTSTASLVDALVYEFLNHDHSNSNITNNVSHKDIVNRFVNTDRINYKDSEVINYEHPQYLNREGYNSDLDSVYENAFLGDLFISRVLDEAVQKFKGLDKDSYKIMFGDPATGPTLKYSYLNEVLTLSSVAHLNGLYIKTSNDTKYSLRLNNTIIKSNDLDNLKVQPQGNVLDITSNTSTKYKVLTDTIISEKATIRSLSADTFNINNISFGKDPDNNSVTVKPTVDNGSPSTLKITAPVEISNLTVDVLTSPNSVRFKKVRSNEFEFEDISFISVSDDNVQVVSKSSTKELEVLVPLYAKTLTSPQINAGNVTPTTITIGDITFGINSDPDDQGIVLLNNSPDTSSITLEGTVNTDDLKANALKALEVTTNKTTTDILKIGEVTYSKTTDNNVEVASLANKITYKNLVEFDNIKINNSSLGISSVDDLTVSSLKIGDVLFSKTVDKDVVVTSLANKVVFQNLVEFENIKSNTIESNILDSVAVTTKSLTLGDITFTSSDVAGSEGLVIKNNLPETSTINFQNKVGFDEISANTIVSEYNTLNNVTSKLLKIGAISFYKTVENNLTFSGSANKVIFNTVAEFIDTKIINEIVEKSVISDLTATSLKIGEVYLKATVDGDLALSSLVNKIIFTADTLMNKLTVNTLFTSPNNILDTITSQSINFGKVNLSNIVDDLVITSDTNKLIVQNGAEFSDLKAELFEAGSSILTEMTSDRIKIGEVLFNKSVENNVIVTSIANKLIIRTFTEIDNLLSDSISTEELISDNSALTTAAIKELNIGGVSFSEDLGNDVNIESDANKISISAPVEIKKLTSFSNGDINLHTVKSKHIRMGNHSLLETVDGDVEFKISDSSRPDSTLSITSTLMSKVFKPFEIRGENASGLLNSIEINTLKIGNSTFGKLDNKTIIEPKNPATDEFIINTNTLINKVSVGELSADEATVINTIAKNIQIGAISLHVNASGNTLFSSSNTDKVLEFQAATKFLKTNITRAIIERVESLKVISDSVEIGNVLFNKAEDSGDVVISNNDTISKIKFETPVEFLKASVINLSTVDNAEIPNLTSQSLNIAGFIFKRVEGSRNLVLLNESQDKFEIKTPTTATKFTADVFSAGNYTLYNNDKISIDDKNYISNTNNRIEIANDKTVNIVGSSKNSGLSLSHESGAKSTFKQYISANSGANAIVTEKNVFFETETTKGIFLLQPTTTKRTKDSVVYGFNDTTAQVNISDLTAWFRSDLYLGELEATAGHFGINEKTRKNGISIGDTRISVTGIDTDCPPGLTIFESQDTINFVKPLNASQEGCRDVIYQSLNTGPLSVEGILSVDGSLSVTEDIIANGTIGATDISLNGNMDAVDVSVGGDLNVKGLATFASEISFKNDVFLDNDLNASGRIKGRSLDVREDILVNKSLTVMENITVENQLNVKGGLNLNSGLTAEGVIKAEALSVVEITAQNMRLLRNLEISGSSEIQGTLTVKSTALIESNLTVNNTLDVKDNISTKDFYCLRDAVIKERLTVDNGLEVKGTSIAIGDSSSQITLTGKLQIDTSEVKLNSSVYIYEELKVTGDVTSAGEITAKGGLVSESYLKVKGAITTDSSIESASSITARTMEVSKNLTVDNSITANNITTTSISVENNASIANLNISKSLAMPVDTSIVAGDVKFGSIVQTNPNVLNSFSGKLSVSGGVEFLKGVEVGQNLSFNNNSVVLNSNGLTGDKAIINVATLTANSFTGNNTVQTPNHLAVASNEGAKALGIIVPQRKFARIDHLVSDGIAIFNQALTADTIYYKSLIYAGKADDNAKGAVDITAMRALYS